MTTLSHKKYQYAGVCEGVHVFRSTRWPRKGFVLVSEAKITTPEGRYRVYNCVPETCSTIAFSDLKEELKLCARK